VFGDSGVYITSIKPNLGHSEGASGLTSLLKAVLSLEHRTIPPNIKSSPPNPKVPFECGGGLTVPIEATPWPEARHERVSVNSFGIGGANAHVILDSAACFNASASASTSASAARLVEPKQLAAALVDIPQLFVYSATSP
jgi:acyl transferase domain-containing protein